MRLLGPSADGGPETLSRRPLPKDSYPEVSGIIDGPGGPVVVVFGSL